MTGADSRPEGTVGSSASHVDDPTVPAAHPREAALSALRDALRKLHRRAGEPSTREISRRANRVISHTTVQAVLRCDRLPRWQYLDLVVDALQGNLESFQRLWLEARDAADQGAPGRLIVATPGGVAAAQMSGMVSIEGPSSAETGESGVQYNIVGRAPMVWPHRVGVVPALAACFQRRQVGTNLDLSTDGSATVVTHVLSGLGGIGKTQLAAAYAQRLWNQGTLDLLVWVAATSPDSILATFARTAVEITGVEYPDPASGAERLLAWLATTTRRWLIVLDDLQVPTDLNGLWPPASPGGRVIVTTRRRDSALTTHGQIVTVDVFTPAESSAYLRTRMDNDPALIAGVDELAGELGHLPLALSQAAAYMLDRGISCDAYRRRLNDHRRRLVDLTPEPGALPDDHRTTFAATWSLTIAAADQLNPSGLARPLLNLVSVLDPNAIPISALVTPAARTYLAASRSGEEPTPDASDVQDALRNLYRLNLVNLDADSVAAHGLVQRATRDSLSPRDHQAVVRAAADALIQAWPDIERDAALGQMLRANAAAVTRHANDVLFQPGAHPALFRLGRSYGEAGLVRQAIATFSTLHETCLPVLGPDHPDTLASRINLARWRGEAGDAVAAVAALEQLLADRLRVLGPDHPATLTARSELARWQGEAGDPAAAAAAYEQLLPDIRRVLGPDHPDTLRARSELAWWQGKAGDRAGAVGALVPLLADRLRVLGPDHPDTLATRQRLGDAYRLAGRLDDAITLYQQVIADRLRVLGPDHPDTLATRHELARCRAEAGNPAAAVVALEQLLIDRLRVLGPDHPHTLATRNNLAYWQGEGGDAAGAAAAFEALLGDSLRVLGPDHPDTLAIRHELAHWRGEAGDPPGDIAEVAQLLVEQGDVGEVLAALRARADAGSWYAGRRLADLLVEQGRVEEAISTLRGQADAGSWYAGRRLADLLVEQGRVDEAISALRTRIDAGDEEAARRLADLLVEQGRVDEAISTLRGRPDAGSWYAARRRADQLLGNPGYAESNRVLPGNKRGLRPHRKREASEDRPEQGLVLEPVTVTSGFAYGVVGADVHVFGDGAPVYTLENWQGMPETGPAWLRSAPSRMINGLLGPTNATKRHDELGQLSIWREDKPRLAARLLHGPGGAGKTQLAAHLAAESAAAGWKVVAAIHGSSSVLPPAGSQDLRLDGYAGVLLIVDYADRWPLSHLTWLLSNALLHQVGVPTRILLLGRTTGVWPALRAALASNMAATSSQTVLPRGGSSEAESFGPDALELDAAHEDHNETVALDAKQAETIAKIQATATAEGSAELNKDDLLTDEPPAQAITPGELALVARLSAQVFVIDGRPRYHLPSCTHLLDRAGEPLPIREAIELEFTPCALCRPNALLLSQIGSPHPHHADAGNVSRGQAASVGVGQRGGPVVIGDYARERLAGLLAEQGHLDEASGRTPAPPRSPQ